MKRAEENGAEILNHTKSTDFIYDSKSKVRVLKFKIYLLVKCMKLTLKVINAAGPWVDEVRKKIIHVTINNYV